MGTNDNARRKLRISAFYDITAFILQGGGGRFSDCEICYVPNADKAHTDLKCGDADVVFMSYDDTLSLYFEESFTDILAVMPVHGGILDLTGEIDRNKAINRIGIDTNSGYARALRQYFKQTFAPLGSGNLQYIMAGATNVRFEKLVEGNIDATLLNPPFSYMSGVSRIIRLSDVIGFYQGIVANVKKSWFVEPDNRAKLESFAQHFYARLDSMKQNPATTIDELMTFYPVLTQAQAEAVQGRLWDCDGLAVNDKFDVERLATTEKIYSDDTGQCLKLPRTWVCFREAR